MPVAEFRIWIQSGVYEVSIYLARSYPGARYACGASMAFAKLVRVLYNVNLHRLFQLHCILCVLLSKVANIELEATALLRTTMQTCKLITNPVNNYICENFAYNG